MNIKLRLIKNSLDGSRFTFNCKNDNYYYLDAPILADFKLSFESLAPFVCEVLDQAAPLEGCGLYKISGN